MNVLRTRRRTRTVEPVPEPAPEVLRTARRRRVPEASPAEPPGRVPPPAKPKSKRDMASTGLRPIWRIAADIHYLRGALPFEMHAHKLYDHWRTLFCLAYADDVHTELEPETAKEVRQWNAADTVREFADATQSVKQKRFQTLRSELLLHLREGG